MDRAICGWVHDYLTFMISDCAEAKLSDELPVCVRIRAHLSLRVARERLP